MTTPLIDALRSGTQADEDGTFVKVSRQACEEAANLLIVLAEELKDARAALAAHDAQPVDWLPYDDQLRFVARVLEGSPPQQDKDEAAAIVRAMRVSLRPPPAQPQEPVDQKRLYSTDCAAVWAEEFAKVAPDVDRGLMVAWFANCAENAKNQVRWKREDQLEERFARAIEAELRKETP